MIVAKRIFTHRYEELLRQHSELKGQLRRAHEERDDNGQSNGFGVRFGAAKQGAQNYGVPKESPLVKM